MRPRPLSKMEILNAMDKTKSVRACSRYLNLSYSHVKKWMKFYKDDRTQMSLFEFHKNQAGKGIPKYLTWTDREIPLIDLIEGGTDISSFSPQKIKMRMIKEGLLPERCNSCSYEKRRAMDYKVPLLLNFKDGNKKNFKIDNVQLLCYNCFFMQIGDVFEQKQVEAIEDYVQKKETRDVVTKLELDNYQENRLREIGVFEETNETVQKLGDIIKYI